MDANRKLWEGWIETVFLTIPPNGEHSIKWILSHLARIEDMTMNLLVAGTPQLYTRGKWAKKLKATTCYSANRMDNASVIHLSQSLSKSALREYRTEAGCCTREIISSKPCALSKGYPIDHATTQIILYHLVQSTNGQYAPL